MLPWTTLTLLLLAAPGGGDVAPRGAPPEAWAALQLAAHVLDLCAYDDPRWRPTQYGLELGWVRTHWRLTADAPPLAEAQLFAGPAAAAEHWLGVAEGYQAHVGRLQGWYGAETDAAAAEVLAECRRRANLWLLAAEAGSPRAYPACRRLALGRLRDLLGDEAYYRGELPFVVPLECFAWR